MKIDRKELFRLYMEQVNQIAEECDWKTSFSPEEVVGMVVSILENNPHLVKNE